MSVRYGELAQEENSFHKRVLQHQIEHAKYAIAVSTLTVRNVWTAPMDLTARMGSELNVLWDGMGNFWLRIMP